MLPPTERRAIAVAVLAIVAIATLAYVLAGLFETPFASTLSIVVAPAAVGLYWLQQRLMQGRRVEVREHVVVLDENLRAPSRFELPRPARFETLARPGPFSPPAPSAPAPSWLESEMQSWKDGKMGWNPPRRMQLGRPCAIEVVLGTQDVAKLRARLENDAVAAFEPVKIGTLMRVQLIGAAFDITSASEIDQPTFAALPTRWEFSVVPKQAGSHKLGVRVAIRMRNGQQQEVYDFEVLKRDVEVWVGWGARIADFYRNWTYPVLVVLAGLIGTGIKYLLDLTSVKTWIENHLGPAVTWLKALLGF